MLSDRPGKVIRARSRLIPPDRVKYEWTMNELMSGMTLILGRRLDLTNRGGASCFLSINRGRYTGTGALRRLFLSDGLFSIFFSLFWKLI